MHAVHIGLLMEFAEDVGIDLLIAVTDLYDAGSRH